MSLSVREVLRRARKLLSKRENWTREAFARNSKNEECKTDDPEACKFCILGSIQHIARSDYSLYTKASLRLTLAMKKLFPRRSDNFVTSFNDAKRTKHADVLKVFDEAICSR